MKNETLSEKKSLIKLGDILFNTELRRLGIIIKIGDDFVNVDFGGGDVYGIVIRRIEGNIINK